MLMSGSSIRWAPLPNSWRQSNCEKKLQTNYREGPSYKTPGGVMKTLCIEKSGLEYCTPITPTFWGLIEEGHRGFEPTLSYSASARPAWAKSISKQANRNKPTRAVCMYHRQEKTEEPATWLDMIPWVGTLNTHTDIRRKPRESG